MKADKYTYEVVNAKKYKNVIEVDLNGIKNYNGRYDVFFGAISIDTIDGWRDFNGEFGKDDFVNEFGIKLILNPKYFNYDN